jgi:hypothetical protein
MSPIINVVLNAGPDGFNDDKDEAKRIRENTIIPTLAAGDSVVLDFSKVKSSTQSFVHALVGEALQRFREPALENIQFKSCTPLMKGLVQLVVDYSLGGFRVEAHETTEKGNEEAVRLQMPKPKQAPYRTRRKRSSR